MLSMRYNEKEVIKNIFKKLFAYSSYDDEYRIDTDFFIEDFSDTVKEFTCPICLQVSLNPIVCSDCNHIFCKTCQRSIKCPLCKRDFREKKLDGLTRRIFETLLLKCKNCEKYNLGGSGKIKISEYLNHLRNCEFSDYICLTCNKIIYHSKPNCYKHAKICGYSDSLCSYCSKTIKLYLKKEHENKCGVELIELSHGDEETDDFHIKIAFDSQYNDLSYANLIDYLNVEIRSYQKV